MESAKAEFAEWVAIVVPLGHLTNPKLTAMSAVLGLFRTRN